MMSPTTREVQAQLCVAAGELVEDDRKSGLAPKSWLNSRSSSITRDKICFKLSDHLDIETTATGQDFG